MSNNFLELMASLKSELAIIEERISKKEVEFQSKLQEQNFRLAKLWNGYKRLGLIQGESEEMMPLMNHEKFFEKKEALLKKFEMINVEPVSKEEMYKSQDQVEVLINEMMNLIQCRFFTCVDFIEIWRNERKDLRQHENLLQDEYTKLMKETNVENKKWTEHVDTVFKKHIQLIEGQIQRITKEEIELNEMESLFEMRETYYDLAVKVFST